VAAHSVFSRRAELEDKVTKHLQRDGTRTSTLHQTWKPTGRKYRNRISSTEIVGDKRAEDPTSVSRTVKRKWRRDLSLHGEIKSAEDKSLTEGAP
jgi:hypothetical protein